MNSIAISFSAAGFSSLSSLFFRKNTDHATNGSSSSGYLVLFYIFSLALYFLFFPDIWEGQVSWIIVLIGVCVGLLSSTLMALTSEALQRGPAGLTFAFQNASAIFPGMILFLLLGPDFGFSCSVVQLIGMMLVLIGLFRGATEQSVRVADSSSEWLTYALACFIIQIAALTCIQARCVLFPDNDPRGVFSGFSVTEADDIWFMPGQFGASLIMQTILFLREKRKLQVPEIVYGSLAGVSNFASTGLLLLSTKLAMPFEKGILFPCYAVGSMVLCNIWAKVLYKERFNLKTNLLCSFGIFMAVYS
jgi:hypothetical protein